MRAALNSDSELKFSTSFRLTWSTLWKGVSFQVFIDLIRTRWLPFSLCSILTWLFIIILFYTPFIPTYPCHRGFPKAQCWGPSSLPCTPPCTFLISLLCWWYPALSVFPTWWFHSLSLAHWHHLQLNLFNTEPLVLPASQSYIMTVSPSKLTPYQPVLLLIRSFLVLVFGISDKSLIFMTPLHWQQWSH